MLLQTVSHAFSNLCQRSTELSAAFDSFVNMIVRPPALLWNTARANFENILCGPKRGFLHRGLPTRSVSTAILPRAVP